MLSVPLKCKVSLEHSGRESQWESEKRVKGKHPKGADWHGRHIPLQMHRRKPSQMASFQGLKGPSVFFKP